MKGFFPLGSYSKPLALKIGIESAVLLFELIKDFGSTPFKIYDDYGRSIGIETISWSREKLINNKLIKPYDPKFFTSDLFIIDYEYLDMFIKDEAWVETKKISNDCLNACKKWIAYLKKKGYSKDLGQFLNEVESKDEMDLCYAIQYSIDNGYKSLFFQDSKRVNQRSRINTTGDKTDSDKGRDYSGLIKKAGS